MLADLEDEVLGAQKWYLEYCMFGVFKSKRAKAEIRKILEEMKHAHDTEDWPSVAYLSNAMTIMQRVANPSDVSAELKDDDADIEQAEE